MERRMNSLRWSRRTVVRALGIGAVLSPAILRSEQAWAQVNKSGAGGLAPPSNGSFLVPIIHKLELDKKNGLDFDINLYSDPSTLYSDLARQSRICLQEPGYQRRRRSQGQDHCRDHELGLLRNGGVVPQAEWARPTQEPEHHQLAAFLRADAIAGREGRRGTAVRSRSVEYPVAG